MPSGKPGARPAGLRVRNDWVDTEIPYALVEERGRYPFDRLTSEWRKPLLIFHGLRDDMVPYTQSLQFMQQAECPKIELSLLKDGDHRLTAYKEEIAEAACAFFGRWQ
jgi:alpha-beta hydrolase superfamily lysophospholipase